MVVIKNITLGHLFLAELLLCYLTGNIFGVEISCGWHADDVQMTRQWDFGQDFTGGWYMSSTCRLHIIRMSSGSVHVVRTGWQQLCIKPTGFLVSFWSLFFSKNIGGHFPFLGPRITLFWISQWCLPCALSPTHDGISRFNSYVNTANLLAASMAVNPASKLFFQGKVWDQLWNWV